MVDTGWEQLWPLFVARVDATPDLGAVLDETGHALTWAELSHEVEKTCVGLARLGVVPGSTVSWQLPTSIDAMTLALALCRMGVVQNPIIPMYRARELRSVLSEVKPSLVFVEPDAAGRPVDGPIQEALTDWNVSPVPRVVALPELDVGRRAPAAVPRLSPPSGLVLLHIGLHVVPRRRGGSRLRFLVAAAGCRHEDECAHQRQGSIFRCLAISLIPLRERREAPEARSPDDRRLLLCPNAGCPTSNFAVMSPAP